MTTKNMYFLATLITFLFSATTASADMFVNLLDMPQQGASKGAAGMMLSSTVDIQTQKGGRDAGDIERQSFVVSASHGLSSSTAVYAGLAHITDADYNGEDVDGNSYFGGAFGQVDFIQGTKLLAFGQYKSFDEEGKVVADITGDEISVGLIGVYDLGSGAKFYIGPEYIFSSDIKIEKEPDIERDKKFGLRVGFSHPMSGNNMSFYGTAGFMNEQSFYLGVSRDFN